MRALHPMGQRAESSSRHNNGCSHSGSETEILQSYIEALERFAVGSLCRPPSLARALALTCARRCAPTRSARATRFAQPSARRRRRRHRQPSPMRLPRARPELRARQPACPRAHSLGAAALARRPSRGRRRAARESGGPPGGLSTRAEPGDLDNRGRRRHSTSRRLNAQRPQLQSILA